MAIIPPFFSDCVAAIGFDDNQGGIRWGASGFFYGYCVSGPKTELDKLKFQVFLVTNKHVVRGEEVIYVRVNPAEVSTPAKGYKLSLMQGSTEVWWGHSDESVDVAIIPINFNLMKAESMQTNFFEERSHTLDAKSMQNMGITEGDGCLALGFPMGLVGAERNTVIVRGGTVARIRETFAEPKSSFLIDCLVFPGNSGGPVVNKPDSAAINGTQQADGSYLIGIVSSYIPYEDIAVSPQTGRARIVFEENSGLTKVFSVDCIHNTIKAFMRSQRSKLKARSTDSAEATETSNEVRAL